jgi:hypothetical protein
MSYDELNSALNSDMALDDDVFEASSTQFPLAAPAAAHVPSPLQNVLEDAEVPELRLVTGKFPVTPLARLICAQAGLLLVPVLDKYRVAFVSLFRADRTFVADAYNKSPCAKEGMLAPDVVAKVPEVGKVTVVVLVIVPVNAKAPDIVKFPPTVMVLPVLATPVPPNAPVTTVNPAASEPLDKAPTVVMLD